MMVALDGYVADARGDVDWLPMDDELLAYTVDTRNHIDTMLMGRVNYTEQAAYWPTASGR